MQILQSPAFSCAVKVVLHQCYTQCICFTQSYCVMLGTLSMLPHKCLRDCFCELFCDRFCVLAVLLSLAARACRSKRGADMFV